MQPQYCVHFVDVRLVLDQFGDFDSRPYEGIFHKPVSLEEDS